MYIIHFLESINPRIKILLLKSEQTQEPHDYDTLRSLFAGTERLFGKIENDSNRTKNLD